MDNELQVDSRGTENHDDVWRATAQVLRAQVSEAVWFSTFNDAVAVADDKMSLRLQVPNTYVRERILTRYMSLVRDALDEVGASERQLLIDVQTNTAADVNEQLSTNNTPDQLPAELNTSLSQPSETTTLKSRTGKGMAVGLNPRYTFETFVKGTSNQFALAAAQRVAETPGRSYNPLFIYGSAGLGKTHLLHAIGYYVHQNYAHYEVRYVSTETFLNEYVDGIRSNTIAAFKRRYREVDVLLIDDIQFMEGKEGLQEEFFHTFNTLHSAGKQIVITSDRTPKEISLLEERLRSRFEWGLIADISSPDLETRIAILRSKVEESGVIVADDVLEQVARRVQSNVRELEGALTRLVAVGRLSGMPVTMELAARVLSEAVYPSPKRILEPEQVVAVVAEHYGVTVEQLRGPKRDREIVVPRQIAAYLSREETDASLVRIGGALGGRDHSTIIHACSKIEREMSYDAELRREVALLREALLRYGQGAAASA